MTVRTALNRTAYIDAALEVIGRWGRQAVNAQCGGAVAGQPHGDVQALPTKDDLLAASLEAFIARARVVPDAGLPWEQWVEQAARGMYGALSRN